MKKTSFISMLTPLIAIALSCIAPNMAAAASGDPGSRTGKSDEPKTVEGIVIGVTDSDTVEMKIDGKSEIVQLIGVEAPETRFNDLAKKQANKLKTSVAAVMIMGESSRQYTKGLLPGGTKVKVETGEKEERDTYGRLLAYVWNGKMLVNAQILGDGYAFSLSIPPNVKYTPVFEKLYKESVSAKRGLWASFGSECYT